MKTLSGRDITFKDVKSFSSKYTSYITFVVLFLFLAVLTRGGTLQWSSIKNLIVAESVRVFAALGVGMIIITKGIDLSIGAVVCLSASVAASFSQSAGYQSAMYPGKEFALIIPIVTGILAGTLFGLLNGWLIAYGKLPPFIATLGTKSIATGIQLLYTHAAVVGSLKREYKQISQGNLFGTIPYLGIYILIIAVIVWVILRHTKFGTSLYAIGGNAQAARVSGIAVEKHLIFVYIIAGCLYGVAGVLQSARVGLANSLTAQNMELDAIAAVTVGGVSQSGGVGTLGGMMIGVFIMGLINYGMTYLAIDSYWQQIVKGLIIVGAVYMDMKKYARRG